MHDQRRSAPVLGRSNVEMPKGLEKLDRGGTLRVCCARGRAHSAVAYPVLLAVTAKGSPGGCTGAAGRVISHL
jgi:hypothetical protein